MQRIMFRLTWAAGHLWGRVFAFKWLFLAGARRGQSAQSKRIEAAGWHSPHGYHTPGELRRHQEAVRLREEARLHAEAHAAGRSQGDTTPTTGRKSGWPWRR